MPTRDGRVSLSGSQVDHACGSRGQVTRAGRADGSHRLVVQAGCRSVSCEQIARQAARAGHGRVVAGITATEKSFWQVAGQRFDRSRRHCSRLNDLNRPRPVSPFEQVFTPHSDLSQDKLPSKQNMSKQVQYKALVY